MTSPLVLRAEMWPSLVGDDPRQWSLSSNDPAERWVSP
jgi:hypothetical protein